ANQHTGGTTIVQGTVVINTIADGGVTSGLGRSSSDASNLVLGTGNATLRYSGTTASTNRGLTTLGIASAIEVTQAGTALTFSGEFLGAGYIKKVGAGTLVLSGNNTYAGQ